MIGPTDDIDLGQCGFDSLGPSVRTAVVSTGRTVHYIDEGDPDWQPLVFFGGAGTSVRAFRLLEFARSLRERLRIRVVSVERNGLGQTPFDPAVGYPEHAGDVWAVLDQLGLGTVSLVAVSGGGPYAAHVVAARPERVRSLHLACAYSERIAGEELPFAADVVAADPVAWWRFPPESPVHYIPGFADSAIEEATRAVFALGRDTPPDGLRQAFEHYLDTPLPDLSAVCAPAFLYWGAQDPLLTTEHLRRWQGALKHRHVRLYRGEGHEVQYRHWDQILADVAFLGERIVLSLGGRTILASPGRSARLLYRGAVLGMGAWASAQTS